jgi:hypothetical protein
MSRILLLLPIILLFSCKGPAATTDSGGSESTISSLSITTTSADSMVFDEIMRRFLVPLASTAPLNHRIIEAGRAFLGTPYVASTLEAEGDEKLIVNLKGVDCTTFVEYATAMAITSQNGDIRFIDFARELAELRYRNGIIDGYTSRLHYFTDWLKVNERRGYVTIISDEIGNADMEKGINFMTSNPQYYRQLQENPSYIEIMAGIESSMYGYEMRYITKDVIEEKASLIHDGDIIAFVTTIKGLDVSHTGLALHQNGKLHFMHASLGAKEVEITSMPLSVYLQGLKNVSGILVARVDYKWAR